MPFYFHSVDNKVSVSAPRFSRLIRKTLTSQRKWRFQTETDRERRGRGDKKNNKHPILWLTCCLAHFFFFFFGISCHNFLLLCEREAKKMLFSWDLHQSVSATRSPFKTRWVQVVNWVFWTWESPGLFPIKMKQLFRVSTRVYRQRRFKMYERTFAIPPTVLRLLANENVRNLMPDGMWYSWALLDLICCFFRAKEEENLYNLYIYFFPICCHTGSNVHPAVWVTGVCWSQK